MFKYKGSEIKSIEDFPIDSFGFVLHQLLPKMIVLFLHQKNEVLL